MSQKANALVDSEKQLRRLSSFFLPRKPVSLTEVAH